jgi:hypothetical protein
MVHNLKSNINILFTDSTLAIGHPVSWGYPYLLCRCEELSEVIKTCIAWHDRQHLKPIWLNLDARAGKALADELGWQALCVIADQCIHCDDPTSQGNKRIERKVPATEW